MFDDKLAVSVDDAADALSISKRSMYALVRSGDIPSFKAGGRRLVRVDGLHDYIDRKTLQSA